jgi:hypothetical protein
LTRARRRAETGLSVERLVKPEAAMASPAADLVVLDTLGKLYARPWDRRLLPDLPARLFGVTPGAD